MVIMKWRIIMKQIELMYTLNLKPQGSSYSIFLTFKIDYMDGYNYPVLFFAL